MNHVNPLNQEIPAGSYPTGDRAKPAIFHVEDENMIGFSNQSQPAIPFQDVDGFNMEHKWLVCYPRLKIRTITRANSGRIETSSEAGCFCCCFDNSQRIELSLGGQEIISFVYKPEVWYGLGSEQERVADIYMPDKTDRVGFLRYTDRVENNAVLIDCMRSSSFTIINTEVDSGIGMRVLNHSGIPVASAFATDGSSYRGFTTWTNFQMNFVKNEAGMNLTVSEKAMILVTFAMWVLGYRERSGRYRLYYILIAMVIGIILSVVIQLTTNKDAKEQKPQ